MIDMLVLRCDIQSDFYTSDGSKGWTLGNLMELGIPTEQSVTRDGITINTRHPWEQIPSSYEHLAFKVFDHRHDKLNSFYIEIKGSPAKLMQGHNVYGSTDFYDCCMTMMYVFVSAYPVFGRALDHASWYLAQIDLTYSSRAYSQVDALLFIKALANVSHGQTKARDSKGTTVYFGRANSRLRRLKVYLKGLEVSQFLKSIQKSPDYNNYLQIYDEQLINFSSDLIRWEASLYHRYLERLGISCYLKDLFKQHTFSRQHQQKFWDKAFRNIFNALEGQEMKVLNDTEVKEQLRARYSKVGKTGKVSTVLADSAFRTYKGIRRDGWEVIKEEMAHNTFHTHVRMLVDCGLSKAALQNMTGLDDGAQIILFVRFIQVDFGAQYPEGYAPPAPKHVYQPKPVLKLVSSF